MLDSFILAGGQSKRFGKDKLLYKLNGKRMIDYTLKNAYTFSNRVYMVVKETQKFSDIRCDGLIVDVIPEQASIVGLLTSLLKSASMDRFVLSGDMPFVDREITNILLSEHSYFYTVFSVEGKIYPFPGIYNQCITGDLCLYIKEGGRSIRRFLKSIPGKIIEIDPTLKLLNINSPSDITIFQGLKI